LHSSQAGAQISFQGLEAHKQYAQGASAAPQVPAEGETHMTEAAQTTPAPAAAAESSPVSANPAVARCMNAWERAYKAEKAKRKSDFDASEEAEKAYRNAMPPLSGYENIRDFIACVAHAMLIGAIRDNQGTKLLYAAQVALTTVRRQPAASKPEA
jgi:hypothetical protein